MICAKRSEKKKTVFEKKNLIDEYLEFPPKINCEKKFKIKTQLAFFHVLPTYLRSVPTYLPKIFLSFFARGE